MISNGPFILEKWSLGKDICMKKNKRYWDKDQVKIKQIFLSLIDQENTAMSLFENQEIDFIGYPFCEIPIDAIDSVKTKIQNSPFDNVFLLDINSAKYPFNNKNIRKAFAYSIERKALIKEVSSGIPALATTFNPYHRQNLFVSVDIMAANKYLDEGLKELGVSKKDLDITLIYNQSEYNHKICQAIQYQWKKHLGVDVKIESQPFTNYLYNFSKQHYQMARISWFADFSDPIAYYHLFPLKFASSMILENKNFLNLILSSNKAVGESRKSLLEKVERVLIEEMMLIPIHYSYHPYLKSKYLKNISFCKNGEIDFKWAYLDHD